MGENKQKPGVEERALSVKIANFLDRSIKLPGTDLRIGFDGIIGLIPGIGDLITTGLGSYIVLQAAAAGVPYVTLARMVLNVLVDLVIGSIPMVGDIADFFWKANERNIRLWDQARIEPEKSKKRDGVLIGVVAVALAAVIGLAFWLAFMLVQAILSSL